MKVLMTKKKKILVTRDCAPYCPCDVFGHITSPPHDSAFPFIVWVCNTLWYSYKNEAIDALYSAQNIIRDIVSTK